MNKQNEPTRFSRRGQDLIAAEFGALITLNALGRSLAMRVDTVQRKLRKEGYLKAFVYAEHTPHPVDDNHAGYITVTYDKSPARGDGWAVRFELDRKPYAPHAHPKLDDAFYVPDLEAAA